MLPACNRHVLRCTETQFVDVGTEPVTGKMGISGSPRSFVARIWLEGRPGGNQTWRGHVRHVQGEEEGYFETLSELSEFLERISGVPMKKIQKGAELTNG